MLYSIKSAQLLHTDADTLWQFISSPRNLALITPPYMRFTILNDPGGQMYAGQIIEYAIRPVLGIKLHWVTEITHVAGKTFFVDEQRFGPYAFWHHKHTLRQTKDGVDMTDEVHYQLPLGILGRMAHALFVKRQLQAIFDYRRQKLDELFNTPSIHTR